MSEIKMLNLFRCSSAGDKMIEKDIHYFVTDYFDGIKVEDLNPESTTLAECMGIKKEANKNNVGISHQRYCLYSEEDTREDIFEINQELPVLTVIQVFINPDIYQSVHFAEDGKDVACRNCMDKVQELIQENLSRKKEISWKMYRLLTAGDFAIIVRSKRIHDAYDISTLVRSICMAPERSDKWEAVFFTYSISGVLDKRMDSQDIYESIDWMKYLGEKDRIIVRIVYDHVNTQNRELKVSDREMKETLLPLGYRLLGRYDYQTECSPLEFQEMYTYIRNYKFGKSEITQDIIDNADCVKVKGLLWLIKMGHVLRINEKIFLHYETDPLLIEEPIVWRVQTKSEWISLYKNNEMMISQMKKLADEIEKQLEPYYQSERNLKESARLLGRFCRILHEINQMRELRISTANLARQLKIILNSLQRYLTNAERYYWDSQATASQISEYLRLGINDLEIFARYVRNINLQTLQTPNYDLQTNMCIEKILLAYSQFLQPFLVKQTADDYNKRPYHFSGTLYPIVVPNMSVKDLSVCVLFDDYHLQNEAHDKLMIVNNPTFSYLCETCFLLPAVFHEIAHQFRYETHKKRNACLDEYLMKKMIHYLLMELLDEDDEYDFPLEEEIGKVVDVVYNEIKGKMVFGEAQESGLQFFKYEFERTMLEFLTAVKEERTPASIVERYIKRTKQDVRKYNSENLSILDDINTKIRKLEESSVKSGTYDEDVLLLLQEDVMNYFKIQEEQIFEEIVGIIENIADGIKQTYDRDANIVNNLEEFCPKSWDNEEVEEKGRKLFELWKTLEKKIPEFFVREDLRSLLKHYHNLYNAYQDYNSTWKPEKMNREIRYHSIFKEMYTAIYKNLLETLEKFEKERNHQLAWNAIQLEGERLEYLKRRIKSEKEVGIKRRLKHILSIHQRGRIEEFISSNIEFYREITSDLFMCSLMGLDSFGYLMVAAENFVFNSANELVQHKRVSLVLQCLSKNKREMTAEKFSKELSEILCHELNILKNECADIYCCPKMWDASEAKLDEIEEFLVNLRRVGGLTTTQDWILRIFLQIAYIIFNIKDAEVACNEISEKVIWEDMVSEDSYIERKKIMAQVLEKNGGAELCGSIAEILNSPASYFKNKKYLLTEEIKFILLHYERNCRQIFESI